MRVKGAGHMAVLALRILPFASHVCAINLDVNDQRKKLDRGEYIFSQSFRRAELLITIVFSFFQ